MKREFITVAIILTLLAVPFCFAATAAADEPTPVADSPTEWPHHAGPPFSQQNLLLFYTRLWQVRHDGIATPDPKADVEVVAAEIVPEVIDPLPVFTSANVALSVEQAWIVMDRAHIPPELRDQFARVWWLESGSCYCTARVGDGGRARGAMQLHWYPAGWQGWANYAIGAGYLWPGDYEAWWHPVANMRVALAVYNRSGWGPWTLKPWY